MGVPQSSTKGGELYVYNILFPIRHMCFTEIFLIYVEGYVLTNVAIYLTILVILQIYCLSLTQF